MLPHHRGRYLQGGRGLGGLFGSLLRKVLPVAKTIGKAAVKAGRSSAGREIRTGLKNMAVDSLIDVMQGEDVGNVAEKQLKKAATSVLKRAKQNKRKKQPKQVTHPRKRRRIKPLFREEDGEIDED